MTTPTARDTPDRAAQEQLLERVRRLLDGTGNRREVAMFGGRSIMLE